MDLVILKSPWTNPQWITRDNCSVWGMWFQGTALKVRKSENGEEKGNRGMYTELAITWMTRSLILCKPNASQNHSEVETWQGMALQSCHHAPRNSKPKRKHNSLGEGCRPRRYPGMFSCSKDGSTCRGGARHGVDSTTHSDRAALSRLRNHF